jgi:uncharacterized protein
MPPLTLMIKPVSGSCNMACRYCFYCDELCARTQSHLKQMSMDTLRVVLSRVLDTAQERCTLIFQGGEPTLAGLEFYRGLLELERRLNRRGIQIQHSLQTNGYRLTDTWARFFAENNFLVGLSLDGPREIHDQYRVDRHGGGTFDRVMETAALFSRRGVQFNVLSVVTDASAAHVREIYAFFRRCGFVWQQYIPCLDPLFSTDAPRQALTEQGYLTFLKDLFDLWYDDLRRGRFVYNRTFENYVAMLAGRPPENCNMAGACSVQYLVEADGSVYPCDFYAVDGYQLGNLCLDSFDQLDAARHALRFVEDSAVLPQTCQTCRWLPLCRGGCRRERDQGGGKLGIDRFCGAYKAFFPYAYSRLHELSLLVR